MPDVKIGFLLWPQTDSWPSLRDAAVRAERAGAASLWTWDHLMSIVGPWQGPILEGWMVLAGWAEVTERATLGLMVGANTFRNPGLTAKLAITLDHQSNGRAILGIGGAWFEREHDAYGIDFGSGFGERLDRLDESVRTIRRLLDGERFDHDGPIYPMHDALAAPRPVQAHLPIMIGGSGERKTLHTVAKYADGWNTGGDIDTVRHKDEVLRRWCDEVGHDHTEIERTVQGGVPIIRDTEDEARKVAAEMKERNKDWRGPQDGPFGPPELVAERWRPYLELGFEHVYVDCPAPFDHETLERLAKEVRPMLSS